MEGSKAEIAKNLLILIIANICLPTYDTYTDIALIIRLLLHGPSLKFGLGLMVPLFMNIFATTFTWWRKDSSEEKKWTWILVILLIWPQYQAAKVLILLFKDFEKSQQKKMELERDIDCLESCLEAVPTVLLLAIYVAIEENYLHRNQFAVLAGILLHRHD